MNSLQALVAAAVLAASPLASQAQMDHAKSGDMKMMEADQGAAMTDGEVRKVDKLAGKITLRHGEIKNLDMPPMTMVFQVKDKAMLDAVKAGDKIRFSAADEGGKLTVTEIQVVR